MTHKEYIHSISIEIEYKHSNVSLNTVNVLHFIITTITIEETSTFYSDFKMQNLKKKWTKHDDREIYVPVKVFKN